MNGIKTLLQAGKATFGAIVTMPSRQVAQVMSRAGLDMLAAVSDVLSMITIEHPNAVRDIEEIVAARGVAAALQDIRR